MKKIGVSLSLVLLAGCMSNDSLGTYGMSEVNVENLTLISIGMDEAQVHQIMRSPYNEETIQLGIDQYDVWFYVTNPTGLGQTRMVHFNLTPITFKNDLVVSRGWDYYQSLIKSRDNIRNIELLQLGMTQAQVRQIMRTPQKEELIQTDEGLYDILFYITTPTGQGSPCEPASNLTAITFKDNKLVSTDCARYEQLKANPVLPPPVVPGQVDEKSIEKALETPETSKDGTPQPAPVENASTPAPPQPIEKPTQMPSTPPAPDKADAVTEADPVTKTTDEDEEAEEEPPAADSKIDMTQEDEDMLQQSDDLDFDQF